MAAAGCASGAEGTAVPEVSATTVYGRPRTVEVSPALLAMPSPCTAVSPGGCGPLQVALAVAEELTASHAMLGT